MYDRAKEALMRGRRHFLKTSLAGAGLFAVSPRFAFSAKATEEPAALAIAAKNAADRVALGKTGIRCSFLAQGTGSNGWGGSSDHTRLGQPAFTRLVRHSLDEGLNFLDMADQYGSHPFVKSALEGVGRDKVVLLSKIHVRGEKRDRPGAAGEDIDRFRRELGTEMLDVCLVHCVTNDRWKDEFARVRDDLSALKEKGAIRALGVSCHDHGALKLAAADPWVEVIFARINHRGGAEYSCDDTAPEIAKTLRLARANGKAVVGMKIFGAGKLTAPEDRDASLRYVLGSGLVDAMTIGMTSPEQVDDSMKRIDRTLNA
jgi:aryl-alcohol dehydrogenase-like predicted oxidoreductase